MEVVEKGIYQYSLDGVLIAKYNNVNDVVINNEYTKTTINNAIFGIQKTAYGYKWLNVKKYIFNPRSKQIVDIILSITNMEHDIMIAKNRKKEIVFVRQLIHYFLKKETKLSLNQIGLLTGDQDHATTLHSVKKIKGYLEINDADIKYYVNSCQEEINKIRNFYFKTWVPIYDHSKL